ncbi:TetR/AcrR family transcriptional regulator [Mycobacterium sp. CBMA293]|uniref:TetR/AcrR family transcriptional regulator n=1 Tax=unclassified Mycolicibacterium TaxID=2636767 RepID=UPI00132735C3|nr:MULTISPECIES: TetR/AcrR family transcriptional regulator [unclassified Mycolicibacterium]MUL49036.1 TetR/AcrR family transcriptional regulator [Mycolicibacterium sp. CBMA 360]MUL95891.1 TetR/AcrR family transcriptional regulator [Mycolicibacterium sp. CBMA 230]MUM30700.1 TetR/AcrR family transcriptional regulator [Mycolicibacterium sp. CBMA 361]MUL60950.1 TetR/AcrR family transcriptional regulator [Mycolicibacterium sp. CBMA 335]MUL71963.1 TetR/AcrR family transcriptional regulator [Mycolic
MPRSSDARDRLVATAARLFLERSYQAVGVDELCRATDIRKGSFYHYFSSKSELAKAVIDLHAKAFQRQLASSPTATPAEKLHAVPDAIGAIQSALEAQFGRAVGCPFGNFAAELSTTDDDLREHLAHTLKAMEHHLAVIAHEAATAGVLRPGTDPQQLAHALLAQYQGIILLAKLNDSGVKHLAPALHDFVDGYLATP